MDLREVPGHILSEIGANYNDWRWWRGRVQHYAISPFHAHVYPRYGGSVKVMDEDWDNFIVLDACRADLFEEVADLSRFDTYERKTSLGSSTPEWTKRNFTEGEFGDTVYVTANPYPSKLANDRFHAMINVWEDSFDEDVGTVWPEHVVDAALDAHEEYPDKGLIVHFVQPHYPFVGSDTFTGAGIDPTGILADSGDGSKITPWRGLRKGLVDLGEIWDAYGDNLSLGLEYAMKLPDRLSGKTVVTSDHGNMVGERGWPLPMRIYGHPNQLRFKGLVSVPWGEISVGNRRSVTDDGVNHGSITDMGGLNERLRSLGYLNE